MFFRKRANQTKADTVLMFVNAICYILQVNSVSKAYQGQQVTLTGNLQTM